MKVVKNINGHNVEMEFQLVDPMMLKLDGENTRVLFPLQQIEETERDDRAIEMLLFTQEDLSTLKKSICETKGIQEPVYITSDGIVKEGNRRVVAARELKIEHENDRAFNLIPAWVIPDGTSASVIKELVNAAHLSQKRPWPPFERALEFKRLFEKGDSISILAARYEMDENEVKEFISAAGLMLKKLIPLYDDLSDPEIKNKFSYFVEYVKGPRKDFENTYFDLDGDFAKWVKDGNIPKAEKVRKLGKILINANAVNVLKEGGFDAAMEIVMEEDVCENPNFKILEKAMRVMNKLSPTELLEVRGNKEKKTIILDLARTVNDILQLLKLSTVEE